MHISQSLCHRRVLLRFIAWQAILHGYWLNIGQIVRRGNYVTGNRLERLTRPGYERPLIAESDAQPRHRRCAHLESGSAQRLMPSQKEVLGLLCGDVPQVSLREGTLAHLEVHSE